MKDDYFCFCLSGFWVIRLTLELTVILVNLFSFYSFYFYCKDHSNGDGVPCRCLALPRTSQSPPGARLPPHHQEPHGLPHNERETATGHVRAKYSQLVFLFFVKRNKVWKIQKDGTKPCKHTPSSLYVCKTVFFPSKMLSAVPPPTHAPH